MQLHEELVNLLLNLGASFTGFSDVKGKNRNCFSSLQYAVTIGIRLSDAVIDEISDKPTYTYFHHYRTVNALLDQIALRGVLFLQERGYNAVAVPASQTVNDLDEPYCGIFPHKTAAVLAGLGRIGKNGLFIHDVFGPRVRLATILTDLELPCYMKPEYAAFQPLEDETGYSMKSSCAGCNKCVEVCPAMALTGKEWYEGMPRDELVDARACSEYMNKNFKHIGRGSVCGICIKVCPSRRKPESFRI